MKIRPLGDRVIVRRIGEEERTKGGLIIPDTAKEKPMEGEVLAVGKGKDPEGRKGPTHGGEEEGQGAVRKICRDRDQDGG